MAYKQGFLFQESKVSDKFKEMFKEIGVSKLGKMLEKYSKLKVVMNLNSFNDLETY